MSQPSRSWTLSLCPQRLGKLFSHLPLFLFMRGELFPTGVFPLAPSSASLEYGLMQANEAVCPSFFVLLFSKFWHWVVEVLLSLSLFLWLHPWHMNVPRPGIKPMPERLHWQCQILQLQENSWSLLSRVGISPRAAFVGRYLSSFWSLWVGHRCWDLLLHHLGDVVPLSISSTGKYMLAVCHLFLSCCILNYHGFWNLYSSRFLRITWIVKEVFILKVILTRYENLAHLFFFCDFLDWSLGIWRFPG